MKIAIILACTLAGWTSQALAIDGQLPAAIQKKIKQSRWDIEYGGVAAHVIVDAINDWNVVKVVLNGNLTNTEVPVFKFTQKTVLDGVEMLALHLGAKTFAVGDAIHISTDRPAGTNPGGITPFAGQGPAVAPPNGGGAKPAPKGPFTPGSNTTFSWSRASVEGCRSAKKPVLLYIYDKDVKTANSLPDYLETVLFPDAAVQKSLSGFTFVRLERAEKAWPPAFMDRAHNGAALFLLACDGTPAASWDKGGERPSPQNLALAAQRALAENLKAVARVEKDAALAAKNNPGLGEEEKTKKITVPGLGGLAGGEEEKTKTGEPKPAKKTTAGFVEDEK